MIETDKHHINRSLGTSSNRMKNEVAMLERMPLCCAKDECLI